MTLGEKIREARRGMGRDWTQERLTHELNRAGLKSAKRSWVAALETDRARRLTSAEHEALEKVLGKPGGYFADGPRSSLEAISDVLSQHERNSPATLEHIEVLEENIMARLDRDGVEIPIWGHVPAGRPSEALEAYQGKYRVPRELIRGPIDEYMMFRARGSSMVGVGIVDGDLVLCHKQPDAEDGEIVVANVENDGVTCKKLRKKKGQTFLEPANPEHQPIREAFAVIGKVTWRVGCPR